MHRHGGESGIVITVQQLLLELISRNAPIVKRQVAVLLQFISQAPHHHRRMVSVSLHPLRNILLPETLPIHSATGILGEPLVVKLIHHQNAILIAEFQEILAIWIMRGADMVHSEFLHQFQSLLDGTRIGGSTQGTEGMMVGITLEEHLLAVHQQALLWDDFNGAHTKRLLYLVGDVALTVIKRHLGSI